ncbi:MAG: OmpA family protein [Verrucomicrobiota bacterium JB023]|nr:OmpA family protein [Verrucomicrobiota bacterium JB023]
MKSLLLLVSSSTLLCGQTSVVSPFAEDEAPIPADEVNIGIVPVDDYLKVRSEVTTLKKELDIALHERAAAVRAFEQVKGRSNDTGLGLSMADAQVVAALQEELRAARRDWKETLREERATFMKREKELLAEIDALEEEREELKAGLEEQLTELRVAFGKKQEQWEQRIVEVEEQRDEAVRKLEESELIRLRDHKAWEKSVQEWRQKVAEAVQSAQVRETQATVATTAKLAGEWREKRKVLEKEIERLKKEIAKLEGRLGVRNFEQGQNDMLRMSLLRKSESLEDLGAKAEGLALAWREEREESSRELAEMKGLYEKTAGDLQDREKRLKTLREKVKGQEGELKALAGRAEELALTWKKEKGSFETEVASLREELKACNEDLKAARQKLESANKVEEALRAESLALLAKQEESAEKRVELMEKVAMMESLSDQLALGKERQKSLSAEVKAMTGEMSELQKRLAKVQEQREASAAQVNQLERELETSRSQYAEAGKELAQVKEGRDAARGEANKLREVTDQLEQALAKAQADIQKAREQAAEARKKPSPEQTKKINEMEGQVTRLAKAQQDLQGTLMATLKDFEGLQVSYQKLRAEAADGGAVAKEAEAKRQQAEDELVKLREKLKAQEEALEKARARVKQVEEKKNAVEAEALAGKEALGKRESELQNVRKELGQLQLGHEVLVKEAKSLRDRFVEIEPVRYQLASANVIAQQERVLAEVRQILEMYPEAQFAIRGHTCNLGSPSGNQRLSEQRAETLKDFLIANEIPEAAIIRCEGVGDREPEASNETEESRRRNRRVEVEVIR